MIIKMPYLLFQCSLVHHLGCERTFAKAEHMKQHLINPHKRFPVISLLGYYEFNQRSKSNSTLIFSALAASRLWRSKL